MLESTPRSLILLGAAQGLGVFLPPVPGIHMEVFYPWRPLWIPGSLGSWRTRWCSPANPPDVPPSLSPSQLPRGPLGREMRIRNCSRLPSLDPAARGGLGSHPWSVQGTTGHPTQTPCSCCVTPWSGPVCPAGVFQEPGEGREIPEPPSVLR